MRRADQGARERHALPLATADLAGLAVQKFGDAQPLGGVQHLAAPLGDRELANFQWKLDILEDRHVGVEAIVLEHHRDVAMPRLGVGDVAAADADSAGTRHVQPGDHSQRRALPAARRAQQHEELAVGDVDIEPMHGGIAAEALGQAADLDAHRLQPLTAPSVSPRTR